ncbi:MAG: SUMF1/EgtB/PvdO family nonheme iron enzyme [Nitrospirales bacterium]
MVCLTTLFLWGDGSLLQAQELEDLKKGVVKIIATAAGQQRVGTGFIVRIEDDIAYIVTASHVVEGAALNVNFFTNPDKGYKGTTRNMQGGNPKGLAVIRVQGPLPEGIRSLVLASSFEVKGGESATVIGFRRSPSIQWGVLQGILTGQTGADLIVSGVGANEGNSGGPILVNQKVVGVLTVVLDDIGYAVPASITQIILKGWGVRVEPTISPPDQVIPSDAKQSEEKRVDLTQKITGQDGAPMVPANNSPSTDIDKPQWLSSNEIRGEGVGEDISYYYTFMAEPGTVKVIADGKNGFGGVSNALRVVLMDLDANELLKVSVGNTKIDKRVVERVKITRPQQILMRVLLDKVTIDYKVRVEGAVNLEAAPTPRTKTGKDEAPMVLVPAGAFTMGSHEGEGESNEHPLHTVDLDAYYIDQYEVTEDSYSRFLLQTNRAHPDYWSGGAGRNAQKPIVGINWDDAQAYCEWAGKRLPTEAEWEKAARGTDKRTYPWGESKPNSSTANFGEDPLSKTVWGRLKAVGSYEQGKSPYGAYDMAGNVGEWVADWLGLDYYGQTPKKNPTGPSDGTYKILRGGSWADTPAELRSAYRLWGTPTGRYAFHGVRCAQDAP